MNFDIMNWTEYWGWFWKDAQMRLIIALTDVWIIIPIILALLLAWTIILALIALRMKLWPSFKEISYRIFQVLRLHGVDAQETMYWAFGEDYESLSKEYWMIRWNERHGDIFMIKSSDSFEDFYIKIAEAYKNELDKRKVLRCPMSCDE